MTSTTGHQPVLTAEVIELLAPRAGGIYVDCTIGAGGHSAALLQQIPEGTLVGIDRDPQALTLAEHKLGTYRNPLRQVILVQANYDAISEVLAGVGVELVDGVLIDAGVSSMQLDNPERGFSYQYDAPLDMRMDPGLPATAADLVNNLTAGELTRILRDYGEERWAARIATRIVRARSRHPILTTGELVAVIKAAIPAPALRGGPHPAKRTFQALRIAVNDELASLEKAVAAGFACLRPGGRMAVISFHSLEDRIVKRAYQAWTQVCSCPPRLPVCVCRGFARARLVTPKSVVPSVTEQETNPRSRSARLRVVEKRELGLSRKDNE